MQRDMLKLIRDSKLTGEFKLGVQSYPNSKSRGLLTVWVDGEKIILQARKRMMAGSPHYDLYSGPAHVTFYTSPLQIATDRTNGFGTSGGATEFAIWVKKHVVPGVKDYKDKKAKELDFTTKAKEICGGDPRIKFIQDWDGGNLITFRVDDVTEGGKMADFYREYLNCCALPAGWYFEDGQFVEDRERYYKEKKAAEKKSKTKE